LIIATVATLSYALHALRDKTRDESVACHWEADEVVQSLAIYFVHYTAARCVSKQMAKGGQSKPVSAKQRSSENNRVDEAALQAEVKSFASGLGLAAAGIGSGFDDTDFRPPSAEQKSKLKANKPNTGSADKRNVPKRKAQVDRQSTTTPAQQPAETPDVVRERNWNAGVGPRPGLFTPSTGCARILPAIKHMQNSCKCCSIDFLRTCQSWQSVAHKLLLSVPWCNKRLGSWMSWCFLGCLRHTLLLISLNDAGEKQGHSLLARDSPSLWYEAAAALPVLTGGAAAATVTEAEFEAKKQAALAALQNEETFFERDLGACLISIYRHTACFVHI